ncbi:MFS transporter [Roseibium sediminis]|uniref:MFS transporter n=1 Tax=Roseibium sediminis TaxID=1775174 RepID=UPI00123D3590|nr:MFS transporter [Roseibium sediminis]
MSASAPPSPTSLVGQENSLFQGTPTAGLLALALGVGSHAINGFVTTAVLPDILRELGGQDRAFWVFSSFEMMAILAGCLTGAIKQRHGSRMPFLVATAILATGSIVAGLSPVFEGLILGRALQGFGEGMIIALCYALIPDLFPQNVAPKVFAMLAGIWALAAGIGPISAGFLSELWTWRAAFLINIPLTALLFALILLSIPAGRKPQAETDGAGKSSLYKRMALLILTILLLTALGEMRSVLGISFVLLSGLAAAVWLLRSDSSASQRLFPADAFRPQTLIGLGTIIIFVMSTTAAVRGMFVTTFGQVYWDLSVTQASYVAASLAFSWTIFAWMSAKAKNRSTELAYLVIGPVLVTLGMFLTGISVETHSLQLFIASGVLSGAGYGLSNQILNRALMYSAEQRDQDLVSAILPSISSAGVAIGGGLVGLAAIAIGLIDPANGQLITKQAIEAAGAMIFYLFAVLLLLPLAAMFVFRRRLVEGEKSS